MRVTESDTLKHRQLQTEDSPQRISAEQRKYGEVCESPKMTETDSVNTNMQREGLLEEILSIDNLNRAYKQVKRNKGAGGIDGMQVDELLPFLRVNREKTQVTDVVKAKYLGHSFYVYQGKGRLGIHPKSVLKLKEKIREVTGRSNGMGIEIRKTRINQIIRGWMNYFKMADAKTLIKSLDQWIRSRIRMVTWKRWKKEQAWMWANTRKGCWRTAHSPILLRSLSKERFEGAGYLSLMECYSAR